MSDQPKPQAEPTPYNPNDEFAEPEAEIDRSVVGAEPAASLPAVAGGIPLSDKRIQPFMPRSTDDLKALVRVIVRGGTVPEGYLMFDPKYPNDYKKRIPDMAKMAVGILAGRERGWGPITSLMFIMIVRGMPSVWGKGAKGLIFQSGKVEDYRLTWIDLSTYTETMAVDAVPEGHVVLSKIEGRTITAKPMAPPGFAIGVDRWPNELCAYVQVKRQGVTSPFVGRYSVGHAKRQKLWFSTKKQVWLQSPEDMLEHRAASRAWDRGFSDCLVGLALMDPDEESIMAASEPVDQTLLGSTAAGEAVATDAAQAERDILLNGLSRITTKDALEMWFQASEDRVKWLHGSNPDMAKEVNDAFMAKKASFEATP